MTVRELNAKQWMVDLPDNEDVGVLIGLIDVSGRGSRIADEFRLLMVFGGGLDPVGFWKPGRFTPNLHS